MVLQWSGPAEMLHQRVETERQVKKIQEHGNKKSQTKELEREWKRDEVIIVIMRQRRKSCSTTPLYCACSLTQPSYLQAD